MPKAFTNCCSVLVSRFPAITANFWARASSISGDNLSKETGFRGGSNVHGLGSFEIARMLTEMMLIVFVIAA